MSRRILLRGLGAAFLLLVIGCSIFQKKEEHASCTRQIFAMDTVMRFTAYGKNAEEAVDAAVREVQRLDALWSVGNVSSEVSRLNREGEGRVSEDTKILLERAGEFYNSTEGFFDITIYPLMSLWGFPTGEYHVPSQEELAEVLPLIDASRIRLEENRVSLGAGQEIDFGGIGKGYAAQLVMEIYQAHGITSGMVSLGGNVQTLGLRPDGNKWRIGIQDPEGSQGEILAVLEVEDKAVVTSGGYERYFEEDKKTYIHILDPQTGYPPEGDLASVTVVAEDGVLADALSTSLYLMGFEGAFAYWQERTEIFDLILIEKNGEISVTEGIGEELQSEESISVLYGDGSRS